MGRHLSAIVLVGIGMLIGTACNEGGGVVTNPDGPPGASNDAGVPDGALSGRAYPIKLTPLSPPQTSTANISLYFSVVDANGEGVADLQRSDFRYFEDGTEINLDAAEYDFNVAPLVGSRVSIPTVLVLDLSQSVVDAGALEIVKRAANNIIDAMLPEQTLAILSFADVPKVRSPFSADKAALKAAVSAIQAADGASTNLYGAVRQAVGMWEDRFTGASTTGQLTSGLAIVISDGDDTAGATSIDEVVKARGNRRVVTVGVGDVKDEPLQAISNTGFHIKMASFAELDASIGTITKNISTLNRSIYSASYCSPKRAGEHNLVFTVKGNDVDPSSVAASCKRAEVSSSYSCSTAGNKMCTIGPVVCCPPEAPFYCPGSGTSAGCFTSAAAAATSCGTACTACVDPPAPGGEGEEQPTALPESGTAIRVSFNASGYESYQCPKFRAPECKELDACCEKLSGTAQEYCRRATSGIFGPASCTMEKANWCVGPECTKQLNCCTMFSPSHFECQHGRTSEAACAEFVATVCENVGPNCTALRTCCASKTDPIERYSCEDRYIKALRGASDGPPAEAQCAEARTNYACP